MSQGITVKALLLAGATLTILGISSPAISGVLDAAPAYSPPPAYDWTRPLCWHQRRCIMGARQLGI
jgi:hypothetical protein